MGKKRLRSSTHKHILSRGNAIVHLANCPLDKNPKLSMIRCFCFDYKKEN